MEVSDEDDAEPDPPKEPEMEEVTKKEWKLVNSNKPTWEHGKDEVIDAEYQEFFNVVSKSGHSDASSWTHFNAEGKINFKSVPCLSPRVPANFVSM